MFDQMRNAFSQMQPGDKMVMHLHKSQTPPTPQYEVPQASPSVSSGPVAAPAGAGLPSYGASGVPGSPVPSVPMGGLPNQADLIAAMRARFPQQG